MQRERAIQWRWRLLLIGVLWLAFALRLYRLDFQELRGDESFGYFFSLRTLPDIVRSTLIGETSLSLAVSRASMASARR